MSAARGVPCAFWLLLTLPAVASTLSLGALAPQPLAAWSIANLAYWAGMAAILTAAWFAVFHTDRLWLVALIALTLAAAPVAISTAGRPVLPGGSLGTAALITAVAVAAAARPPGAQPPPPKQDAERARARR